jgi:hypothetical protein
MSSALALGAVTAVLKDLLDNALIDHSASSVLGGSVTVSALPPDRIETGETETPRLNLFLYRVAPNAALRNLDLPSRDDHGSRRGNPPLALDLHYLLSAYSAQDFEAEILLGYAMLMLHETPVFSRAAVRRALAAPSPVDGGILPPAMGALATSDLAEQAELVKLTPEALDAEALSRLWTAFGAKYRPSAAYRATVVLIERDLPARSPLPVLSRGEPDATTGKDEGVRVQPSVLPPYPALESAMPPDPQPAVRLGELLTLSGRNLEGDGLTARFTHLRSGRTLDLEPEPGASATGFQVRMPPDPPAAPVPDDSPLNPANWRAGVHAVTVVVQRTGEADRTTNELPIVLAPRLDSITAAAGAGDEITVTVAVSPPVRRTQRARLVVRTLEVPADPFPGESADTLEFTSSGFPAGPQWVRLRVDEAESLLVDRSATPPAFDPTQQVVVP